MIRPEVVSSRNTFGSGRAPRKSGEMVEVGRAKVRPFSGSRAAVLYGNISARQIEFPGVRPMRSRRRFPLPRPPCRCPRTRRWHRPAACGGERVASPGCLSGRGGSVIEPGGGLEYVGGACATVLSGALAKEPLVALLSTLGRSRPGYADVMRGIGDAGRGADGHALRQPSHSLLPGPAVPYAVD